MTLLENSMCARLFLTFCHWCAALWDGSALSGLCHRIWTRLRRKAEESAVCRALAGEGLLPRKWRESISRFLFQGLLDLPCRLVQWIYEKGRRLWDGSVFCRLFFAAGNWSCALVGLFVLLMLIVPHSRWNNAYGFLGAVAVTALFVLACCAARPARRLEGAAYGPYMFFYLLCVFGALAYSLSVRASLRFFLFYAAAFLLAVLVRSSVEDLAQLRLLVALAVAGAVVAAIYGCYQGYIGVEIVPSQQDAKLNVGMPGRVYSFFDNPNNFAEILVMLIPLDLGLLFSAKGWRERFMALAALVPCLCAIGMTYGRSCWIGLALAFLVFIALLNWRLVPVMIVLGILAIPFLPSTIYNRILTIGDMRDASTRYRFAIYLASGNLLEDYWLRGVGLGTDALKQAFQRYPTMYDGNYPIHTHNNYLEMWCELGLAGGVAYIAMLLHTLKTGLRIFCFSGSRRLRYMLAGSLGALCGIMVVSVAEYTWFYPRNMFIFWFLLGVILACVKLGRKEADGVNI